MTNQEIKKIRTSLGLKQGAFAKLLGVSIQTVNRWEMERQKPSNLACEMFKTLLAHAGKND